MLKPKDQFPIVNLYSPEELQMLALRETLRQGDATDADVTEFLRANVVDFRATFKAGAGVAIAITGITPRPPEPKQ